MALYGLTDEHEPIDIIDREIYYSLSQNIIVAEDNISQLLTFRVDKIDEGIDLSSKSWYFDYIDPDDQQLYNIPIDSAGMTTEMAEDGITEYLIIKIPVFTEITKTAGGIRFALSAIDEVESLTRENSTETSTERQYIWQTKPSVLTILPNLGKRNATAVYNPDSSTDLEDLITEVDALSQDISDIMESDTYNMDSGESNDGEVILTGGTATEEV